MNQEFPASANESGNEPTSSQDQEDHRKPTQAQRYRRQRDAAYQRFGDIDNRINSTEQKIDKLLEKFDGKPQDTVSRNYGVTDH